MVGWLWLLVTAWFGATVVRDLLGDVLRPLLRVAVGIPVGWLVAGWSAYAVALWHGRLAIPDLVIQGLAMAAFAGWRTWRRMRHPLGAWTWRPSSEDWHALALCAVFLPLLVIEFYLHWLGPFADGLYSGGSTAIDIGWHGAVASSFLFGDNFPPTYPFLRQVPLTYYFLADFHLASLLALGMSFVAAAMATSIPLILVVIVLIHALTMRLTGQRASAWLAALLFLLNGGLGFFYFLDYVWSSPSPLKFILSWLPEPYSCIWFKRITFVNVIVDGLLPQRPLAYAFALAFAVIYVLAHLWDMDGSATAAPPTEGAVRRWLLSVGMVTGLLPMWHLFAWLALVFLAAFWCLAKPRRAWLGFFAAAIVPALPQLAYLLSNGQIARDGDYGGIYLQPGWMAAMDTNYWLFWVRNLGIPFLFAVPAWLTLSRTWRVFLLPFAALWAFGSTVMLSPEPYNNVKLLQYTQLALMIPMAEWLRRLAAPPVRQGWLAGVLIAGCVACGALDCVRETQFRLVEFSRADVLAGTFIRQHTPVRATFLTAPSYMNVPSVLAGRTIVNPYPLFAWSHGLAPENPPILVDARRIYRGDPDSRALIAAHRIDYIFLGPEERSWYQVDADSLAARFPVVFSRNGVTVLQARPTLDGAGGAP